MNSISKVAGLALTLMLCAGTARASVAISSAATKNIICTAGVCSPTSKNAVLNVNDLTNMLATGDVKVTTGNGAVTIGILSPFAWTSTHRLTLRANDNINVKAQVMVEGTGGLTIITDGGGAGGDLVFYPGGKIDFWDTKSRLAINGNRCWLQNDLQALANAIWNDNSACVALAKDYDAKPDGTYIGAAIPTPFNGTFDGLGHTITNLSINGDNCDDIGLFVETWPQSSLRDFLLINLHITEGHNYRRNRSTVGAIAGISTGIIAGVSVSGHVLVSVSYSQVGGLAGTSSGSIVRSSSTAAVAAGPKSVAGGLVGTVTGGGIFESQASGNVSGGALTYAGGLVGVVSDSESSMNIGQSFASGDVTTSGGRCVGGLGGEAGYHVNIADSYATGSVAASAGQHGGLFGCASNDSIRTSYSTGQVAGGQHNAGYIATSSVPDLVDDYWDIDTSGWLKACGIGDCSGVTGLTNAQLKSALPVGFDPAIWAQSPTINHGYPYLIANPPQ